MAVQDTHEGFLAENQSESEELSLAESQQLQEALDNSKVSAEQEEKKRECTRQAQDDQNIFQKPRPPGEEPPKEKPFSPKQWTRRPRSPMPVRQPTPPPPTLTFQDLIDVPGVALDVVYHKPIYEFPLEECNVQQRPAALFSYYSRINMMRTLVAQTSLYRVPLPNPIFPAARQTSAVDLSRDAPPEEVYVSRAGRQVKRKIYTEVQDNDPDLVFAIKKSKADAPEESLEKAEGRAGKAKKDTPKRPTSLNLRRGPSRAEVMFDKMVEGEASRKQQQKEMEEFEQTLPRLDEEEESWMPGSPPIPKKKDKGKGKKAIREEAAKKAQQEEPLESTSKPKQARFQQGMESASTSQPGTSKVVKATCPICAMDFPQSEIENHASSCGIDEEQLASTSRGSVQKISCEICDRVFLLISEFEAHVKQCIASKVSDL